MLGTSGAPKPWLLLEDAPVQYGLPMRDAVPSSALGTTGLTHQVPSAPSILPGTGLSCSYSPPPPSDMGFKQAQKSVDVEPGYPGQEQSQRAGSSRPQLCGVSPTRGGERRALREGSLQQGAQWPAAPRHLATGGTHGWHQAQESRQGGGTPIPWRCSHAAERCFQQRQPAFPRVGELQQPLTKQILSDFHIAE